MTKITIDYLGNLRTSCVHEQNQEKLFTDAPVDNQGEGKFFSPTDLLAAALGSCMLTILGIYCKNQQLNLKEATCETEKIMESSPRRVGAVRVRLLIKGNFTVEEQAAIQRQCLSCPVAESLDKNLKQEVKFEFLE
jgi:putative redox protein